VEILEATFNEVEEEVGDLEEVEGLTVEEEEEEEAFQVAVRHLQATGHHLVNMGQDK